MVTSRVFLLIVSLLLVGMIVLSWVGGRIASDERARQSAENLGPTAVVDTAVLGLMGLLVAFTFSGASQRFESRRRMIADEANAIGTAYLRLDLLPAEAQPQLREDFRRYVRSRFSVYRAIPDAEAVRAELSKSGVIQNVIWTQAVAAVRCAGSPAIMTLVLSSVNEMINVTTTRTIALQAHPPRLIILLLGVTVLASALLVGHSLSAAGRASLIHLIVFVCVVTSAVYVILDFEYPRIGLIREDHVDAVLNEMLEKMK